MKKTFHNQQDKYKVCLLIPYFGKFPEYFKVFLHSASKQQFMKILIFTDIVWNEYLPENVSIINMTLEKLNELCSKKLHLNVNIIDPYKLCDLKPAYGLIFEDYLCEFDYWAYGDIDLIYGDMEKFLTDKLFNYDIITFREEWISGSFSIFKNSKYINELFMKSSTYKSIFTNSEHFGYDECWNLYSILSHKGKYEILKKDVHESFTWIVRTEELLGNINVYSKKIIKEFIGKNEYLTYDNHCLKSNNGEEFMYYHYISEKSDGKFYFPKWKNIPNILIIDRYGIFTYYEYFSFIKYVLKFFRYGKGVIKKVRRIPKKLTKIFNHMRLKT